MSELREKITRYLASRHGHIFNDDILDDWKEHYYTQSDAILTLIRGEILGRFPNEKSEHYDSGIESGKGVGYNQALAEVRKIIEEILK